MSMITGSPTGGLNINPVYIIGDEKTDGSIRLAIDEGSGITEIQRRIDGIWQPDSFEAGPSTIWVGKNVGIAAAGHHIVTENADGQFHFHTHSDFDGETSLTDAKILHANKHQ